MSIEDAKYLKSGDRLIFKRNGGGLSYDKGRVFTYLAHYLTTSKYDHGRYIQLKECVDFGNKTSNCDVTDLEIYDPEIHKGVEVTWRMLMDDVNNFNLKYG